MISILVALLMLTIGEHQIFNSSSMAQPEEPELTIQITPRSVDAIGLQIWQNECNGRIAGLTSWNAGEDFPSLGIGHFIWYPAGSRGPYQESFPELLKYLKESGIHLPAWLKSSVGCPWPDRDTFQQARNGKRMKSLRRMLAETTRLQTQFMIRRLEEAIPELLNACHTDETTRIRKILRLLTEKPAGIYALVDYVNFKGEGIQVSERYQGQGWGLLQVLLEMKDSEADAVTELTAAADRVLTRRVKNAPRDESRWLQGWRNRLKTYTKWK